LPENCRVLVAFVKKRKILLKNDTDFNQLTFFKKRKENINSKYDEPSRT
jgi:hypothetical protein